MVKCSIAAEWVILNLFLSYPTSFSIDKELLNTVVARSKELSSSMG
jgi:hypothetical protein